MVVVINKKKTLHEREWANGKHSYLNFTVYSGKPP